MTRVQIYYFPVYPPAPLRGLPSYNHDKVQVLSHLQGNSVTTDEV